MGALQDQRKDIFQKCTELHEKLKEIESMAIFDEYCLSYGVAGRMFYKLAEQYRFMIDRWSVVACEHGRNSLKIDETILKDYENIRAHLHGLVGKDCMPDGSRHCHMSSRSFGELRWSNRLLR